jgi:hemerythrin-like domain-containing protein
MKRHAALQDLSRDHQLMLMQARHIRWLEEAHPRAATFADVLAGLLAFWESDGEAHLREEEAVLLPALSMLPQQAQRMNDEHAALRHAITQLRAQPNAPTLFAFGRLLHDHVRWEERDLFEAAQAQLSEAHLAGIGRRSLAFRAQHSRPIGPFGAACAIPEAKRAAH